MKQHMTQLELTKTKRLIENGVTDVAEIQKVVFCHADKIKAVLKKYDIEPPAPVIPVAKDAEPAEPKDAEPAEPKVSTKKAAKKGGAAAAAANLPDPIS